MDAVAAAGIVGLAINTPAALPAGSDVACLSVLGYNPVEHYTGRAPLEAAAQGIELAEGEWAIRCNLVTIENQVMKSYTAGQISTDEARQLLAALQQRLADERLQFSPGVSYRNLLIYRAQGKPAPFSFDTRTTPPHDLTDKPVIDDYPRGPGSDLLAELMSLSEEVFAEHPVNVARRAKGKPPATNVWLWGLGSAPRLPSFVDQYGKRGTIISAVDLLHGLAQLIGWQRINVPGATGYLDTDYAAKGRYAIEAIKDFDLVCVHIEATDEASHEGNAAAKVKALEEIDRHIVGPLHEALKQHGEYRILITPDHPTPLRTKTHSHGPVPYAMAGVGIAPDTADRYSERTAEYGSRKFDEGWRLMGVFLGRESL